MTFLEKIQVIERVDALIRRKATGSAVNLAQKLGVSRRCVFDIIKVMKEMDAPIEYCHQRKSYYYKYDCDLMIGFVQKEKVVGGKEYENFECDFSGADFLHSCDLSWA